MLLYPSDEEEEAEPFRPSPAFASGEKLTEVISPTVDPYMKPTDVFKRLRFEEYKAEGKNLTPKRTCSDASRAKQ